MNESKAQRTPLAGDEPRKTNPYASVHTRLAMAWKQRTPTLPDDARAPGLYGKHRRPYPVCLPLEFASTTSCPRSATARSPCSRSSTSPGTTRWPAARATTCATRRCSASTHCSRWSPIPTDQARLRRGVDIAEVLPIEDGRFLTFEYIGPEDYFGEGIRHGQEVGRRRGTNCTSVDAAFLSRPRPG